MTRSVFYEGHQEDWASVFAKQPPCKPDTGHTGIKASNDWPRGVDGQPEGRTACGAIMRDLNEHTHARSHTNTHTHTCVRV